MRMHRPAAFKLHDMTRAKSYPTVFSYSPCTTTALLAAAGTCNGRSMRLTLVRDIHTDGEFVNRLGDIAAESGRFPKDEFVRWTMQLLSVTVQRGNAEMYRRSGLVI